MDKKSQEQKIKEILIYLPKLVFSHGQLYLDPQYYNQNWNGNHSRKKFTSSKNEEHSLQKNQQFNIVPK